MVPNRLFSTSTYVNFVIRHEYASLAAMSDRLGKISGLIDWDAFRSLLADLYTNADGRGGRPSCRSGSGPVFGR